MVTSESSAIADSADEQHILPEPWAARFGEVRVIRRGPVNESVLLLALIIDMPTVLLANVLAPNVAWGIGDDNEISLPFSMLATLLAALLERRFARAAGLKQHALLYSVRVNILSWLLGLSFAYALIELARRGTLFFGLVFAAIPFSIAIEGAFLSFVCRLNSTQLAWKPIVFDNILCGLVLLGVKLVGFECGFNLQESGLELIYVLRANRLLMSSTVMYLCIAIFLLGAVFPVQWLSPNLVTGCRGL